MKRRTFLATILGAPAVAMLPAIPAAAAVALPTRQSLTAPIPGAIEGVILEAGPIHELFTLASDERLDPYTYSRSYVIGTGFRDGEIVQVWRNGVLIVDLDSGKCAQLKCNGFGIYTAESDLGVPHLRVTDGDVTDTRGAVPVYHFEVRRS